MKDLNKQELLKIEGGIKISGTLISSLVRGINTLLELGRSLGTAIRRSIGNNLCPL
ncbi:MAG: hypothetical protein PHW32_01635 [Bacilli bacterium]|nr:hypothetical protein [Bacilli bacterium]MDD4282476.1 hypothetical protein [Bacilli bacterium]MDD4719049.1 hypothetical protein [Bacilli bacterium]